ncbi:MAG: hypothetical protein FWE82_06825 [Defluviitaleaceae bacterium]|nr:hypothetical protein [Defluviitaleaceae bacterium]
MHKLLYVIFTAVFILSVCSCGGQKDNFVKNDTAGDINDDHEAAVPDLSLIVDDSTYYFDIVETVNENILAMGKKDLRIAVPSERTDVYAHFAKKFTERYPNVTIEILGLDGYFREGPAYYTQHPPFGEMYSFENNAYAAAMAEMILSGDAPDLFVTPGWHLPNDKIFMPYLADIYELINSDPLFDHKDYFMNVIDAYAVDGKLYEFPVTFSFDYVGVHKDMPDSLIEWFKNKSSVNWFELLEIYEDIYSRQNGKRFGVYEEFFYRDSFRYAAASYMDFLRGRGTFDGNMLIKKIASALTEPETIALFYGMSTLQSNAELKRQNEYMFVKLAQDLWPFLLPTAQEHGHSFLHLVPLTDEYGAIFLANDREVTKLCVAESSPNKVIAWEFIKFIMLPESNGYYPGGHFGLPSWMPTMGVLKNLSYVYKPGYMANCGEILNTKINYMSRRPFNVMFTGSIEENLAVISKRMEQISMLPMRTLPPYICEAMFIQYKDEVSKEKQDAEEIANWWRGAVERLVQ